jgi:hypothetical protein
VPGSTQGGQDDSIWANLLFLTSKLPPHIRPRRIASFVRRDLSHARGEAAALTTTGIKLRPPGAMRDGLLARHCGTSQQKQKEHGACRGLCALRTVEMHCVRARKKWAGSQASAGGHWWIRRNELDHKPASPAVAAIAQAPVAKPAPGDSGVLRGLNSRSPQPGTDGGELVELAGIEPNGR